MNTTELRTQDEAGLAKEIKDLQRAHFNLRMQKPLSNSATRINCAKLAAASLAPKPSLPKSKPPNKEVSLIHV